MNEPTEELVYVKKSDFTNLLLSIDLLTNRFATLLQELEQKRPEHAPHPVCPLPTDRRTQEKADTTRMKTCGTCGRNLDMSAKFCDLCGRECQLLGK